MIHSVTARRLSARNCKASHGTALMITLAILTLATLLILGMLHTARLNRAIANRNKQHTQAGLLSQMALDHATAQLRATILAGNGMGKIWASQPGRITIVNTVSGEVEARVPLYSLATVSGSDSVVDLNAAGFNGGHPIISGSSTMAADGHAPRITAQWVNVPADPNATVSATNPIVGRYAFWVDDETTKLNINTADGGLKYTGSSYGPGTPAEVNLNALFDADNQAAVDLITARSGIRSGTTARAFNNISELMLLADNASIRAAYLQHHGDLTHYNRAPEINIFHEPRIYLVTTIPGPPQNSSSPNTDLRGIYDLTGGGPIWKITADSAGAPKGVISGYTDPTTNSTYGQIVKLATPLTSVYPSSGNFVYESTVNSKLFDVDALNFVQGTVSGNQLPLFVPYDNPQKFWPENGYINKSAGLFRYDFSPEKIYAPHDVSYSWPHGGPRGNARTSVPVIGSAAEPQYPLPQFATINQAITARTSTDSDFPLPYWNSNSPYVGLYGDNYMLGHRIAQYLKGLDSAASPLRWPKLPGAQKFGSTAFSEKYNDRQLDSIALQITTLPASALYADLKFASISKNGVGYSQQPLLLRGYLSGEPITGIGRSPKLTAVSINAESRLGLITDRNEDLTRRCEFEVPQVRLAITLEYTLPKLFAGYALDSTTTGPGGGLDQFGANGNIWTFGGYYPSWSGNGSPPDNKFSFINTQDAPGLNLQDSSRNIVTIMGAERLANAGLYPTEYVRNFGFVPGRVAAINAKGTVTGTDGSQTPMNAYLQTTGAGPGMMGMGNVSGFGWSNVSGFWMNKLLQVDIIGHDASGRAVTISDSFDLTGGPAKWPDADAHAESAAKESAADRASNILLNTALRYIPLHAYAADSVLTGTSIKGSGPSNVAELAKAVRDVATSDDWAVPVFQMERYWSVSNKGGVEWTPGLAKKASNVYGDVFYSGAATGNKTYNDDVWSSPPKPENSRKPIVNEIITKYKKSGVADSAALSNPQTNSDYGRGITVESVRIHGGLAIWTNADRTPLDSVRGPYYTGESIDSRLTVYTSFTRDRVLAAVIPVDLTIPIGEQRTLTLAVEDPLVNKFPGDWVKQSSAGGLSWEAPVTSAGRRAEKAAFLTDEATTSAWLPEVSGSAMPKIARFPSTGFLQFIHTGIIPDGNPANNLNLNPKTTDNHYQELHGTPHRILNFSAADNDTQRGYPDWAMLDLFTVPATLQPITGPPPEMPNLLDPAQVPPAIRLTYGGATSGRINPNAELITYETDDNRAGAAAPIYRTLPLQALFQGVAAAQYNTDGSIANRDRLNVSEAQAIAEAIVSYQHEKGRPFILSGEIANVDKVDSRKIRSGDHSYRNDLIRQTVGNLTTRSNTFSVWTMAQSIKKSAANRNHGEYEPGDTISGQTRMHYIIERRVSTGHQPLAANLANRGADNFPGTQDDRVTADSGDADGDLPKFDRYPLPYQYRVVYAEKLMD